MDELIDYERRKAEAYLQAERHYYQQTQLQQMAAQHTFSKLSEPSRVKVLDTYERTQLALQQLQILFLTGDLEKHELRNATRMTLSLDKENLTIVEEIIKSKLS